MSAALSARLQAAALALALAALALAAPGGDARAQRAADADLALTPTEAPSDEVVFQHLTVESGLANAAVYAVTQDALGFIWIGTADGLDRYDGLDVVGYRHDAGDDATLSSNVVQALAPGPGADVWVGTATGLDCYDAETDRVLRIESLAGRDVLSVAPGPDDGAWVGTTEGLFALQPDGSARAVGGLPDPNVRALYPAPDGALWLGTGDGLALLDGNRMRVFRDSTARIFDVMAVAPRSDGTLLVGTSGEGLFAFDPGTGAFDPLDLGPGSATRVVSSALEDAQGGVWAGTIGGGLRRVRTIGAAVYTADPGDSASLTDDGVSALHQDRQGVLWVATYGGLDRFDRARGTVRRLRHEPGRPTSLASNDVLSVLPGDDGSLYVGTDRSLDITVDGRTFAHLDLAADDPMLSAAPVRALLRDADGRVWAGTEGGGFFEIRPSGARRTALRRADGDKLSVESLLEDSRGRFWIGTLASGLLLYDRQADTATRYSPTSGQDAAMPSNVVKAIAETADGAIWVGTQVGVCRLLGDGRFACLGDEAPGLAAASVMALRATDDGSLWIGTRTGFFHRGPDGETTAYTEATSDLPSDLVSAITEDDDGFLWLSTSRGLARFEPITQTFSERLLGSDALGRSLGGAAARGPDGALYLGGTGGLLVFEPEQLAASNPNPPQVALTAVLVDGQPLAPDAGLDLAAPVATELELDHDQDVVTFRFAGLHFSQPDQNRYRYRLDGFDDAWREAGRTREATYTNLSPGDYGFMVQASSADGVWSDASAGLAVEVEPPWWRTLWAMLAFGALAVFGLVRADRWQRARLLRVERARAERRETELRAETAEAETRKAEAEAERRRAQAKALRAENERAAAELERAREVEAANEKLAATNERLEASLAELREAQDQLVQSEKLASLGQLTAGIAHEIKNPLNFINNFAGLSVELAEDLEADLRDAGDRPAAEVLPEIEDLLADLKSNAALIVKHGSRADRIVKAMLLHSRGGSGDRARVDLNRYVEEYAGLAYHGARANDQDFQVELVEAFADDAGEADVVPQDLGRVLLNLLGNAFHAVSKRRATAGPDYAARVTVRTRRDARADGDAVTIEIEDNGTGMDAATQARIFEPFFTTKPTGEGTGLGLSLAHDIVTKLHGGALTCTSAEGEGSTFRIEIPAVAPPELAAQDAAAEDAAAEDAAAEDAAAEDAEGPDPAEPA